MRELAGVWGAGYVLVLGQMKHRYKELEWTRPHDIPKVFPPLPDAALQSRKLNNGRIFSGHQKGAPLGWNRQAALAVRYPVKGL